LIVGRLKKNKCVIVQNKTVIHSAIAELWQFNRFSKWWLSAKLDFEKSNFSTVIAFSALTLLAGWQEGHLACKNCVVRYLHSYLSGARCK